MSSFDDAPDPGAPCGTGPDARSTKQPTAPSTARVVESEFDIEPLRACRRLRPHPSRLDTPLPGP